MASTYPGELAAAPAAARCTYDNGSMYGNGGQCPDVAAHVVTYRNGSGPTYDAPVCGRHLSPMRGRVHPGLESVRDIG